MSPPNDRANWSWTHFIRSLLISSFFCNVSDITQHETISKRLFNSPSVYTRYCSVKDTFFVCFLVCFFVSGYVGLFCSLLGFQISLLEVGWGAPMYSITNNTYIHTSHLGLIGSFHPSEHHPSKTVALPPFTAHL